MQVQQERICRFCKKLLNPPQKKRVPMVSVLTRFKNKELLAASGQESVVLARKLLTLWSEFPCIAFLVPDKSFVWFIFAQ